MNSDINPRGETMTRDYTAMTTRFTGTLNANSEGAITQCQGVKKGPQCNNMTEPYCQVGGCTV